MSIGVADRKTLWGRSGNTCAYPTCHSDLIPAADEATGSRLTGTGILIGEEAHIRSSSTDGPRHDPSYQPFDSYENLILLCPSHHTLVDKGSDDYSVETLERMKSEHETWVRSRLSKVKLEDLHLEILVAAAVQRVEEVLFDRWPTLYWQLDQAIPHLSKVHFDALVEAGIFLLARDWPLGFPRIAATGERLRRLLSLLGELINESFEWEAGRDVLKIDRPEKRLPRWDPPLYAKLFEGTQVNMVATWWLTDELTYELNQFIHVVREELDPSYRFEAGVLLVPVGDGIIRPVRHTRMDYPGGTTPRGLPRSLDALREAVKRTAFERGVDPQQIHPSAIQFS